MEESMFDARKSLGGASLVFTFPEQEARKASMQIDESRRMFMVLWMNRQGNKYSARISPYHYSAREYLC